MSALLRIIAVALEFLIGQFKREQKRQESSQHQIEEFQADVSEGDEEAMQAKWKSWNLRRLLRRRDRDGRGM